MDRQIKLECGGGIRSLEYENRRLKEELRNTEDLLRRERKKRSARTRAYVDSLALLAKAYSEMKAAEREWRNKCESLEASLHREQEEKMRVIHTGAHEEDHFETYTPFLLRPSPTPPTQPSSCHNLLSYYPSSSSNSHPSRHPQPVSYPYPSSSSFFSSKVLPVSYYPSPASNFYP
ncbi:Hypothetical protein SMAX5B_006259 [Scophthalmus maximus]|uniref:Uncharacterized protein n=1 Tax=Scophthalmus maximus TaxID=52904 RepID=A0A2U9BKI1_SCOMX|nr:Hypothetical protein SMAX5B_006259 [Scophthalmus maximus]KAF0047264.1 hypothetical protein F2P81_000897 [Scophthalmus maximus]